MLHNERRGTYFAAEILGSGSVKSSALIIVGKDQTISASLPPKKRLVNEGWEIGPDIIIEGANNGKGFDVVDHSSKDLRLHFKPGESLQLDGGLIAKAL